MGGGLAEFMEPGVVFFGEEGELVVGELVPTPIALLDVGGSDLSGFGVSSV